MARLIDILLVVGSIVLGMCLLIVAIAGLVMVMVPSNRQPNPMGELITVLVPLSGGALGVVLLGLLLAGIYHKRRG